MKDLLTGLNPQVVIVILIPLLIAMIIGVVVGALWRSLTLKKLWTKAELEWNQHEKDELMKKEATIRRLEAKLAASQSEKPMDRAEDSGRAQAYLKALTEAKHMITTLQDKLDRKTMEATRLEELVDGHDDELRRAKAMLKNGKPSEPLVRNS